jgi:hypothetical protein
MESVLFVVVVLAAIGFGIYKGVLAGQPTPNEALVCPHCQWRGHVVAVAVVRKKGISGGKATGALLTAGLSMLATGLSRKEAATRMMCEHCGTQWDVA